MKIRGAVLERMGDDRPFAVSTPLTIDELDLDDPGRNEVLVRMEAAGICHSDLSVVDGNRRRPVPMLLGHEAAGIVEAAGSDVDDVPVGTRVVMTFLPRCGVCAGCLTDGIRPCIAGSATNEKGTLMDGAIRLHRGGEAVHHHLGVSGFATHAVVDRRSVVPVDHDIPPAVASLLGCAVLTGGGAVINAGRPQPGQRVAVVGLGGVGMAALITALASDDLQVIGIDGVQDKLAQATGLGAAETYTPADALEAGVRADVVIEAAGNARAFETAVHITDAGGRTVTVGLPPADARSSISPLALVAGGRSIIGSYLGSAVPRRDIPVFADLWRQGRLPVEALVSATIPLEDINVAMDHLADGSALRQIIDFQRT
ncbi:alcohol dehydrogenase catalytic domain-containing protein [Modestobacter marinus]|uniref:alcohol dehydrogenase catalytic domain-containing protein n=1 Tax=Modestobacter marinus TaxID=477641 RepID=UPI001C98CD40|nr:alcohol dehydrogenase catalytic domain-containing protein [Modestobacter marinus]